MNRVIAEQVEMEVNGKWLTLKAILVSKPGGKRVVYVDENGTEVHSEPLSRSQFKDIEK